MKKYHIWNEEETRWNWKRLSSGEDKFIVLQDSNRNHPKESRGQEVWKEGLMIYGTISSNQAIRNWAPEKEGKRGKKYSCSPYLSPVNGGELGKGTFGEHDPHWTRSSLKAPLLVDCLQADPGTRQRTFQGRCFKAQESLRGMLQDRHPTYLHFLIPGKYQSCSLKLVRLPSVWMMECSSSLLRNSRTHPCRPWHVMWVKEINFYCVKP